MVVAIGKAHGRKRSLLWYHLIIQLFKIIIYFSFYDNPFLQYDSVIKLKKAKTNVVLWLNFDIL